MSLLKQNQVYELSITTPSGTFTWQFVTKCSPLYSSYEQLLIDTGLTEEELDRVTSLRFLVQASLICNDILERVNKEIPEIPTLPMRQYTRYKAAYDVLLTRMRQVTYKGRDTVVQKLADLSVERRPALLRDELNIAYANLKQEVAYWESRLREEFGILPAIRGGKKYPYPFNSRVIQ